MPNLVFPIIFVALLLLLLWLTWKSPHSTAKLRESLFRNVGMPHRNFIGFLLGAIAALLLLTSGTRSVSFAAWFFIFALGVLMFLLVVVRPKVEKELDRFAWGLLVVIVLGFGFGALIYQSRSWWIWLWGKYRLIDRPHELVLEFLFLLGVIMGVFVVRNWAKEDEAFTKSLSGILGGTFIAGVFGEAGQGVTTMQALTYYGLGFVMSAAVNLLVAARLTANYTNKRSISSRALLDFLYGSDRTRLIDGYFLKNFKEDPDYAQRGLTETLIEWRKLIRREFAERMDLRREKRRDERDAYLKSSPPEVQAALAKLRELRAESNSARLLSDIGLVDDEPVQKQIEIESSEIVEQVLNQTKPSFFYELIAIECDDQEAEDTSSPPVASKDREYKVVYRYVDASSPFATKIEESMFRVGVSVRWQDTLEPITAPGQYRVPFPYRSSVAGLALEFRQTIVMNRDIRKRFRNKDYPDGICPKQIEQDRGLDEIEYLSYIVIPIVSRPGSPGENPVGVVTIDTKLFVSHSKLKGDPIKGSEGVFSTRLKKAELTEYATNLYDQDDKDVKYIDDLTRIITPVLELYSKCRVGAI